MILRVFGNIILGGMEGLAKLGATNTNTSNTSRVITNGPDIPEGMSPEYDFAKAAADETLRRAKVEADEKTRQGREEML